MAGGAGCLGEAPPAPSGVCKPSHPAARRGGGNVEEASSPALEAPGNHFRGVSLLETFCLHSGVWNRASKPQGGHRKWKLQARRELESGHGGRDFPSKHPGHQNPNGRMQPLTRALRGKTPLTFQSVFSRRARPAWERHRNTPRNSVHTLTREQPTRGKGWELCPQWRAKILSV